MPRGPRAPAHPHLVPSACPALRGLEHPRHGRCKVLASLWPGRATMDTSPASPEPFLAVPQAEVLQELLQAQLGPLPRLAAICRLKRLPSGSYSTMDDLHLVLERRRVANAKERERVRVQGRLNPTTMPVGVQHPTPGRAFPALLGEVVFVRLGGGPSGLVTLYLHAGALLRAMGTTDIR